MLNFYRKFELMGLPFRVKEYSIAEIFEAMDIASSYSRNRGIMADGFQFAVNNQRLFLFRNKGTVCVTCGLEATHFLLESQSEDVKAHLNLYARVGDKEILFTKDHIFPKSKGGLNEHSNYQTMCSPCNRKKGSKVEEKVTKEVTPVAILLN